MLDSYPLLEKINFPAISRLDLETLQVNLGYKCNLQCQHCHVNAGPNRQEIMDQKTLLQVLDFVKNHQIKIVDLTGGAPEIHPYFCDFVKQLRDLDCQVMVRSNLVILNEPEYLYIKKFMAHNQLVIMASLPCYLEENVDKQRGKGTFLESIDVLQQLNQLGYGKKDTGLEINLVYNPQGADLPPAQSILEHDYKKQLFDKYQIEFNHLFTITNLPIKRFGSMLMSKGEFNPYMQLLQASFKENNLEAVMCRSMLSVDWQGYLYDCDFNQMLELSIMKAGQPVHISDYQPVHDQSIPITVAGHCYGCTAGSGSSCAGVLNLN